MGRASSIPTTWCLMVKSLLFFSLLLLLPWPAAAQQRWVRNGGTYTSGFTISAPNTIVEMNAVSFSGSIAVVIDIASMSSTARPVWVTLCNCQFSNGAAIYFSADTSAVDTKKPVYIKIEGATFTSAGLGFKGYFPPVTKIVIAHCNVYINSRASTLPLWNPFNGGGDGRMAYWMALFQLYLRMQSSIMFTGCFFGGTWAGGSGTSAHASYPINIASGMSMYDRSTLWIRNTTTEKVFMVHVHGNFYASTLSTFVVENMTMVCDRFCLSFTDGTVSFSDRSAFVMQDSFASVPLGQEGEDLFYAESSTLFTTSSAFIIKNNVLSPYRYAFSVATSVAFTVSTNSIASFYKNSVAGTPWRMTISTNNGGIAVAQCNDLAGAEMRRVDQYQTAGLNGLTAASGCPRRETDCQYSNSSCFMPGTTGLSTSCQCVCNSIGVGIDCLSTIRPLYANRCVDTATVEPTPTVGLTLTQRESATRTIERGTVTVAKNTWSSSLSESVLQTTTVTYNGSTTVNPKKDESKSHGVTTSKTSVLTISSPNSKTDSHRISATNSPTASKTNSRTKSPSPEATVTSTARVSVTHTDRVTQTPRISPTTTNSFEGSKTVSVSYSNNVSASQVMTPSETRHTPSFTSRSTTVTLSVMPPVTDTVNLISVSWIATATESHVPSPTSSVSGTSSWSRSHTKALSDSASQTSSGSKSITVTRTMTTTNTVSRQASVTMTLTSTFSISNSSALTLSRSHSATKSRSECDWFTLGLNPFFPLVLSPLGNNTMAIDYLSALEYGEHFNLSGLGQWYIIRTDFVGESSGVNATTSPDGNVADVVSGSIPTYYSPETQRQVLIEVVFRCAVVNHRELYTINIIPLPPILAAAELETLLRLTSLASVLTVSPAAAAAAALSLIMQQIMLCRPLYENSAVSLAGLEIGEGDPRYLRGALATNALVVVGEAVVVMIFASAIILYSKSKFNAMRFWRVMEMLQWPNVMHISVSALMQLSTTAAVSLMSISNNVEDGMAAILAFSCCLAYTVWISKQVYVMHKLTTGPQRKWNVAEGLTTSGFVFGDYSKAWFVALETVVFFLVGLIAGIPPSLDVCIMQLFFIFFASLFVLVMLAWQRPYKTMIGLVFAIAVHSFICMAAMSLIIGRYTRNPKGPYTIAAFCLLFIPVAALLRGCWDIFSVGRNAKAWWTRATTAECLQDMPWDQDDEYEDAESSEDEEMLNFGVAAPEKEPLPLDAPLLQDADGDNAAASVAIPPLKPSKGGRKGGKNIEARNNKVSKAAADDHQRVEGDINDLLLALDDPKDTDVRTSAATEEATSVNNGLDIPELRSSYVPPQPPPAAVRGINREEPADNMDDLLKGIM